MKVSVRAAAVFAVMASLAMLSACDKASDKQQPAAAQQQMPKTMVDVQTIELQTIPVVQTFAGRVAASETAEVRPQVSGVVEAVLFREGSVVKAGQSLYRINVDNYTSPIQASKAAVESAESAVANAQAVKASAQANLRVQEASLAQARADLARLDGLLEVEAISRQAYDQAVTTVNKAKAGVEAAQASVQQADAAINSAKSSINSAKANLNANELNLSRTIVKAPISGVVGISSVTSGALVSANQQAPLVTISRLDYVFVDISQSSAELLRLREQITSGKKGQGTAQVQLALEDGQTYPLLGRLVIEDAKVNQKTGAMTLRAVFPNPQNILIPGMYVNARLIQSVVPEAALLPQTAIIRTPKGETQVYVVNAENKVEVRNVQTAGTYHGKWIVSEGLQNGDKVIVMGGAKVKPEQEVAVRELPPTASEADGSAPAESQPPAPTATARPEAESSAQASENSNKPSAKEAMMGAMKNLQAPTQAPSAEAGVATSDEAEAMQKADSTK